MNWLDIAILAVVALTAFEGLRKGFTRQLLELAGIVLAFILASRYGAQVGAWLPNLFDLSNYVSSVNLNNPIIDLSGAVAGLYNGLGYIIVFFLVVSASRLAAVILSSVTSLPIIGSFDKLAGAGVGFLKGFLLVLAVVWIMSLLPIPSLSEQVDSSAGARILLNIAPSLYQRLQGVIGFGGLK